MTFAGLVGAILFLGLGVLELALLNRSLYPVLRWRHEKAKLTQEHGIDPNRFMLLFKIQCLFLMPLLGFYFGREVLG
jgi:hypothetical protein